MRIYEFDLNLTAQNKLNPVLWHKGKLLPEIKPQLLKVADDFKRFVEVPFTVYDIQITGSQVSYWYTQWSDLDLHLIVDYRDTDCDREAEELFDTKRHLYKQRFDIEIYGIPVELYVEDINEPSKGAAYSLVQDRWLREPVEPSGKIDLDAIKDSTRYWSKIIKQILAKKRPDQAEKIQKMMRIYRKRGLNRHGELGVENLTYKALRNQGLLRDLADLIDQAHSRQLSLKNSMSA